MLRHNLQTLRVWFLPHPAAIGLRPLDCGHRNRAIAKDHLIVCSDLLDYDRRWQVRAPHFPRVNHHHTLHGGEPDSPLIILAAGGLIVPSIALAVEHPVRLSISDALNCGPLPGCHLVQLFSRNAVDAVQPTQPEIAKIIFLNIVYDVLAQALLRCECEEAVPRGAPPFSDGRRWLKPGRRHARRNEAV